MFVSKAKLMLKQKFSALKSNRRAQLVLFAAFFTCAFLLFYSSEPAFAYASSYGTGARFKKACQGILKYQEGKGGDGFSSLLAAVAGIGAIVSAAVGGFRMAWALVVVAMGSLILGDFIQTFLPGSCQ